MNCPFCKKEMEKSNKGIYFCDVYKKDGEYDSKKTIIKHPIVVTVCECGRRMYPIPTYSNVKGEWYFWECPHCFKKG